MTPVTPLARPATGMRGGPRARPLWVKNYVTAKGEQGGSESVTGQPNGVERPLTRCYGGGGARVNLSKNALRNF